MSFFESFPEFLIAFSIFDLVLVSKASDEMRSSFSYFTGILVSGFEAILFVDMLGDLFREGETELLDYFLGFYDIYCVFACS